MRRLARSTSVLAILAVGALGLTAPAGARSEGPAASSARVSTRSIVHGRTTAGSRAEATSFDVMGGRVHRSGSATTALPRIAPSTPQSTFGFNALTDPDSFPSDTTGALGDTYFVVAVNTQLAVYDRAGTQVVAPIQLDDLHPDTVGHFAFDPKVVYDPYDDTFVAVYLVQEDSPRLSQLVAVTIPNATATDQTTWCRTLFEGDLLPDAPELWADYPGLGYSFDRVTVTTNQFTFPSSQGRFKYSQVISVTKESLYDCTTPDPVVPDVFGGTQTRDPNGVASFTLRPAESVDLPATSQLMTSVVVQGRNSYAVLWRIKTSASGTLLLKKGIVPIGRTGAPPLGTQGGGGLDDIDTLWDAGDFRFVNAFYDADSNQLFTAHAVFKDFKPDTVTGAYPEAAVRWYEFAPAGRLRDSTLVRKGTIGAPEVDAGWPSVATDGSGNLFVAYSRASAVTDEFLSAWVAEVPPGSTTATQLLLTAGMATYNAVPGLERWGDYTAITRDPVDPTFMATFNQFAAGELTWQQVVHLVHHV